MKYLRKFNNESDYQAFLGGGDYLEPHVCVIDGSDTVFFKSIGRKKTNTMRIAKPSGGGGLKQILSSDGSGNFPYFEYPVTSDIYLVDGSTGVNYIGSPYVTIGETMASRGAYWPMSGEIPFLCTPEEDDTYFYQIIVE